MPPVHETYIAIEKSLRHSVKTAFGGKNVARLANQGGHFRSKMEKLRQTH